MPHFLDLDTIPPTDLHAIIDRAIATKRARANQTKGAYDKDRPLTGYTLALLFEKPSTRTRISFDTAVHQLGGYSITLNASDTQLGRGETIADTTRVLSRYADALVLRTYDHTHLTECATHATIPVINGLTNLSHPCQIMADIMTYVEQRGTIKGRTVVWLGDGNNVCTSFLHAALAFDYRFVFSGPKICAPNAELVESLRKQGADITTDPNPQSAAHQADLLVTDAWSSMGDDLNPQEKQAKHAALLPYQVNEDIMHSTKKDAVFMHCLPAHRGEEVTDAVIDGKQSVVFDEAENRLHVQKAILRWCLEV